MVEDWRDALPAKIVAWAEDRLAELYAGEDCVDNMRVALKSDAEQVGLFEEQRRRGCCGSSEFEEVCPVDGRTYLLGFNYGH